MIALDYFGLFSISSFSTVLFGAVLEQPIWILALVALVAGVYLLNYRFLMIHSYPEEIDRKIRKKQVTAKSLGFMSRFGLIGELISLDLKLILRHKRPKSMLFVVALVMLYGFIFYPQPMYSYNMNWMIFIGNTVTGMMMFSYGQLVVAWEGKFFDGILTRNAGLFDYFRAKFYLFVSFCVVSYLLTTPYAFFGIRLLWMQTACFLFNIGVSSFILLWFAPYNRKRIELSQGSAFNWQGASAAHFISMVPLMLLPIFISFFFRWIGLNSWGLRSLAILGIIGLLCHKWILHHLFRRFAQNKYTLAEGYREN
jgi:hypothetical protein